MLRPLRLFSLLLLTLAHVAGADPIDAERVLLSRVSGGWYGFSETYDAPAFDGETLAVDEDTRAGMLNPSWNTRLLRVRHGVAPEPIAYSSPSDSDSFVDRPPSIGSSLVAFRRGGVPAEWNGVFRALGGFDSVERVASLESAWPVATPPLNVLFGRPSSWGGRIAFPFWHFEETLNDDSTPYVFAVEADGALVEIAGPATPGLPESPVNFWEASLAWDACVFQSVTVQDDEVGFAIHRRTIAPDASLGPVETWVRSGDELPQGGGVFESFTTTQIDRTRGDAACFVGQTAGYAPGIYVASASGVAFVADTTTPIPDGDGSFELFPFGCAIDDGVVAFLGQGPDDRVGVYRKRPDAPLEKVVDLGDTLDGRALLDLRFGREGLAAGRIAFSAVLDRGYSQLEGQLIQAAVYVPEPTPALAGAVVAFALAGTRARRPAR